MPLEPLCKYSLPSIRAASVEIKGRLEDAPTNYH